MENDDTTTNPTTITTEAPAADADRGENWAEAATTAWITAAATHRITATEATDDLPAGYDYGTWAGTVEIDGVRYELVIDPRTDTVRCEAA